MRITFGSSQRNAQEGIARAEERMAHFQRQVSSGLRVARPSDDPSSAAVAVVERGAIASYQQFTQSNDAAESRLRVMDSVLGDVIDKMTAARAAVLSVRGSTATSAQRTAVAQEIRSIREAVLEDLNTSFRGTFVFAGAAGAVRPFTKLGTGAVGPYAGSTREVDVDINRGQEVTVAYDGSAIAQGTDVTDVFAAFDSAAAAAVSGDQTALGAAFDAMGRAFDRAVQAQSRVGTSLKAIADHKLRLGDASRASQERVSTLEDANMATAISGMQEAQTSYEAALGAAARTARVSLFDYLR